MLRPHVETVARDDIPQIPTALSERIAARNPRKTALPEGHYEIESIKAHRKIGKSAGWSILYHGEVIRMKILGSLLEILKARYLKNIKKGSD